MAGQVLLQVFRVLQFNMQVAEAEVKNFHLLLAHLE
jgi:hypothetical protein